MYLEALPLEIPGSMPRGDDDDNDYNDDVEDKDDDDVIAASMHGSRDLHEGCCRFELYCQRLPIQLRQSSSWTWEYDDVDYVSHWIAIPIDNHRHNFVFVAAQHAHWFRHTNWAHRKYHQRISIVQMNDFQWWRLVPLSHSQRQTMTPGIVSLTCCIVPCHTHTLLTSHADDINCEHFIELWTPILLSKQWANHSETVHTFYKEDSKTVSLWMWLSVPCDCDELWADSNGTILQ